ncbi:MAG TPA: hypothetical protein VK700_04160 [Steroidobacteraceae bacterium]|jgi:hypothetical protein|nr:hypothetical protein [Steroidobacteraceae bacterium]
MNRRNLIGLMVAIAATAAVCGRAAAATPQDTVDTGPVAAKELNITRNAWMQCVRAAIPRLDHPESASEAVALAAMNACSEEYTNMTRALARTLAPSCGRDPDCTRDALAKAQREATQAATDEVVTARIRVAGARVLECQ